MQDLIILSQDAFAALRQALKETGVDLCYSAPSSRPVRMRWTPERAHEARFRQAIEARRPAGESFRLASVEVTKPGNRLCPDQLAVTFYAASEAHEAALQDYLMAHRVGMPEPESAESAHEAGDHATSMTYIQVALILAGLTTLEVAAFYLPDGIRPPGWMLLTVLVLLSIVKFGLVASYFMHLRYDHRIYASCFASGLVVATGTIFALVALFRDPSNLTVAAANADTPLHRMTSRHPSQHDNKSAAVARAVKAAPTEVREAGDVNSGKQVFEKYACGSCHLVASIPSAQGRVGPALDGLTERAAQRVPDMSGTDYIRQSVAEPGVYVVKGYLKLMPNLRGGMTDREFDDLVAWLETL